MPIPVAPPPARLPLRVLGLDPGLQTTGWGIVETLSGRLAYVACGTVTSDPRRDLAERLVQLHDGLTDVIRRHAPQVAAVEETFVNKNPSSTLKLGLARGVALLVPALLGLPVAEYPANLVKKSVVGAGHAQKEQVAHMIGVLLPATRAAPPAEDAADALAVALCHCHHAETRARVGGVMAGGAR